MPLTLTSNNSIAHLELSDGSASADVLLFGATVISWKTGSKERLFLSSKSPLDGSSAIRGGIPLVFPVFGPASDHKNNHGLEKVPRHGVARTAQWKLKSGSGGDAKDGSGKDAVKASFELSSRDVKGIENFYQWPFELVYDVTLTSHSLTTSLHITHASSSSSSTSSPMRFQTLQHTYLRVPSSLTASITGLQGQSYLDKTDSASTKRLDDSSIVLNGRESDAVFLGPAPDAVQVAYSESAGQGGVTVRRSPNCPNTTVWNPAEEKAGGMKDLHEGGWKEFVCVEPGRVVGFGELEAGKTFTATQTLEAYDE